MVLLDENPEVRPGSSFTQIVISRASHVLAKPNDSPLSLAIVLAIRPEPQTRPVSSFKTVMMTTLMSKMGSDDQLFFL